MPEADVWADNGFIITWMLHQILAYSMKMDPKAGLYNDIHIPSPPNEGKN